MLIVDIETELHHNSRQLNCKLYLLNWFACLSPGNKYVRHTKNHNVETELYGFFLNFGISETFKRDSDVRKNKKLLDGKFEELKCH